MHDRSDDQNINTGTSSGRFLLMAGEAQPKILVVDDDELELALICDRLEFGGFGVRRASDGAEALEILENEWFPVILTDWQMPVMSGLELTRRLRAKGVMDTYVIILTMLETSFDHERAYEVGVDDYLSKKMPTSELFARIHSGFSTLNLRRSVREALESLAARHAG